MAHTDRRGVPCSTASSAARTAVESATWRLMSFYDVPLADLDAASRADPGWALPHVMKAGFLASLTEPGLLPQAEAHLQLARELAPSMVPRERAHLAAVEMAMQGRWSQACQTWDALLVEHPRDALALQWAHLWDFHRGDAQQLRARPARALPEWDADDPLQPALLGLYAFGLEECREYAAAEDVARQALAADARVPWAIHAVAHVMQMQGRYDDGSAWLRQQQPHWADGNGFSPHLWWHACLFRFEAMDLAGALRLVDCHLDLASLPITLNRLDAASMLWRLHLLGADVRARCLALADAWDAEPAHAGHSVFNDLHHLMVLLGAGELARAEAWLARCAERVLAAADAARDHHAVAREVGLPLARGFVALARGDADAAADLMYPVRAHAARCGGSHAQREVIDLTLLACATQGSHKALGRALVNERLMAMPPTPLTRHWMESLGVGDEARA